MVFLDLFYGLVALLFLLLLYGAYFLGQNQRAKKEKRESEEGRVQQEVFLLDKRTKINKRRAPTKKEYRSQEMGDFSSESGLDLSSLKAKTSVRAVAKSGGREQKKDREQER